MYFYLIRMTVFSLITVTADWIDTKKLYFCILSLFSQVHQLFIRAHSELTQRSKLNKDSF